MNSHTWRSQAGEDNKRTGFATGCGRVKIASILAADRPMSTATRWNQHLEDPPHDGQSTRPRVSISAVEHVVGSCVLRVANGGRSCQPR